MTTNVKDIRLCAPESFTPAFYAQANLPLTYMLYWGDFLLWRATLKKQSTEQADFIRWVKTIVPAKFTGPVILDREDAPHRNDFLESQALAGNRAAIAKYVEIIGWIREARPECRVSWYTAAPSYDETGNSNIPGVGAYLAKRLKKVAPIVNVIDFICMAFYHGVGGTVRVQTVYAGQLATIWTRTLDQISQQTGKPYRPMIRKRYSNAFNNTGPDPLSETLAVPGALQSILRAIPHSSAEGVDIWSGDPSFWNDPRGHQIFMGEVNAGWPNDRSDAAFLRMVQNEIYGWPLATW